MKSASAAKAGLPALREVILPAAMAFCALDAGTVSVYANDIITTFDVSATFDSSCTGCTLGGTVQFDVTTGAIVTNTLDVTMTGQSLGPFTTLTGSGPVGSDTVFNISDASTNFVKLFIPDLNFIGYTGGSLGSGDFVRQSSPFANFFVASGSLTPETAAVPGPIVGAGLPGMLSVLIGGGLFGWLRRRRNDPLVSGEF
jgi:hypothetical protein